MGNVSDILSPWRSPAGEQVDLGGQVSSRQAVLAFQEPHPIHSFTQPQPGRVAGLGSTVGVLVENNIVRINS